MGDTLWSVRGTVSPDGHAALIARLSSLCDGCPVYTWPLHYYDRVYTAEKATRNGGAVSLRAREPLHDGSNEMLYLGPVAMAKVAARTVVKPVASTTTSNSRRTSSALTIDS